MRSQPDAGRTIGSVSSQVPKRSTEGLRWGDDTHSLRRACADVVAQTRPVARVTHEDRDGNLLLRCRRNRDARVGNALVRVATAAVCIVKDLASLKNGIRSCQ